MRSLRSLGRVVAAAGALALVGLAPAISAHADHTPAPATVTLAGSYQDELGCPGDWQPDCMSSSLAYDAMSATWVGNFFMPAGSWEYKVTINGAWDENYGAGGVADGPNIPLAIPSAQNVTFVYDHVTHVVTHSVNAIVTAPGSYQDEVGCPGDWQPDCLTTQLLDPDANGIFAYMTLGIPAGAYEFKIALGQTWDINYGQGGVANGANLPFVVPAGGALVVFFWDSATLIPSVTVDAATRVEPSTWGRVKTLYR